MGFEIKLSDNYKAANVKRIGGFIVTRNWQSCDEEQVKIAESFDPKETVYQVKKTEYSGSTVEVEPVKYIPQEIKLEQAVTEIPEVPKTFTGTEIETSTGTEIETSTGTEIETSTGIEIETAPHLESSTTVKFKSVKKKKK